MFDVVEAHHEAEYFARYLVLHVPESFWSRLLLYVLVLLDSADKYGGGSSDFLRDVYSVLTARLQSGVWD